MGAEHVDTLGTAVNRATAIYAAALEPLPEPELQTPSEVVARLADITDEPEEWLLGAGLLVRKVTPETGELITLTPFIPSKEASQPLSQLP